MVGPLEVEVLYVRCRRAYLRHRRAGKPIGGATTFVAGGAATAALARALPAAVLPSRSRRTALVIRLRLAVEELFVNTATHGHGGDSDAVVDVTVRVDDHRVVLVYEDDAPPFDPFARVEHPDAGATLEARDIGRLGLFLVTQVAAQCRYERIGERNRVTVELPAAQPRRGDRAEV
jgi:serine/threonine-protein kinase RsbW